MASFIHLSYLDISTHQAPIIIKNIYTIGGRIGSVVKQQEEKRAVANSCIRIWDIKLPSKHQYTRALLGESYDELEDSVS